MHILIRVISTFHKRLYLFYISYDDNNRGYSLHTYLYMVYAED